MKKWIVVLAVLMLTLALSACHEHIWKEATCTDAKICSECGKTEGEAKGHSWKDATCTEGKICTDCGETDGKAKGHNWKEATCTEGKTCTICGETDGKAKGHNWKEATCTEAKTCAECGVIEGAVKEHTWKDATCKEPKTCTGCGKTEGSALEHTWKEATCTAPKTCSSCGKTEGTLANHDWKDATCTSSKTCSVCSKTEGNAMGHNWETVNVYTQKCKTCGVKEIDQSKCPISLGSLAPCAGENYYTELNSTKQDIYGNKFSEGLNIRFYRRPFQSTWSPSTCSSEYALNGEYRKFTATIMIDCNSDDTFEGNLKIYVDGVLKFDSNAMNKKTRAIHLEVDISNAVFLKIEASRISVHGTIMLANPILHH